MTVVKSSEATPREFLGVSFDVLSIGEQSMITKMCYRADNHVPFHSHPNEQSGYVLSGRFCIRTHDSSAVLTVGDSYSIPAGVEHSIEILEASNEIQFFTPPREDYR